MRSNADKKKFLEALEETSLIAAAAKRVGIGRATIYRWRQTDPKFAASMDQALGYGRENKNDLVHGKLLVIALSGNVSAMKFFLENNHPQYIKPRPEVDPRDTEIAKHTEQLNSLLEDIKRLTPKLDDPTTLPPSTPG